MVNFQTADGRLMKFQSDKGPWGQVLKELGRLEKHIVTSPSNFPKDFTFRRRNKQNLTDLEGTCLALYSLFRDDSWNPFLIWELKLFLLDYLPKIGNTLGCQILNCSSLKEGIARLLQLDFPKWSGILKRNFPQNLYTALHKLDIVWLDSSPVVKPQRKLGYNDHGSLAPFDKKARMEARNYSDDLLYHETRLKNQKIFQDTLGLIQGWSD